MSLLLVLAWGTSNSERIKTTATRPIDAKSTGKESLRTLIPQAFAGYLVIFSSTKTLQPDRYQGCDRRHLDCDKRGLIK
jgi:hypothetical protein